MCTSLLVINISFLHILSLDFVVPHLWYPILSLIFSDLYVFLLIKFLILYTSPVRYVLRLPFFTLLFLLFYCTSLKRMLTLRHTSRNLINIFMYVTLRQPFIFVRHLNYNNSPFNVTSTIIILNEPHP